MRETGVELPELPNIIGILAERCRGSAAGAFLYAWEDVIYAFMIVAVVSLAAYFASRKRQLVPGRLQAAVEITVEVFDSLICGILGEANGRKFLPFLGTLCVYILFMNLAGLIPFMKSATSSLSTTAALALCVFAYVTYSAVKAHGFLGYLDHLAGKPRGAAALTIVLPLLMFVHHTFTELVRPVTLSLRLRSNVWGDDILLALFAGFGLKGFVLLFFNTLLTILASMVQAVVFCLLSTIYFALVLGNEEGKVKNA